MKPAWQTVEFWVTMVSNVVGILALMGYVSPEQATALNENVVKIIGGLLMLGTSFGFIKGQIAMRTQLAAAVIARTNYGKEGEATVASVQDVKALLADLNL